MLITRSALAGLACGMLVTGVQAGGFIEDSKTSLRYSQYYWNENDGDGVGPVRDEWVQGAQFTFRSGWYNDMLGVDYSYGLANDLNIGQNATSITNLEARQSITDPHGIAKPLEAYLRGKFAAGAGELNVGAGKKIRRYGQYRDDVTRILPAATVGYDLGYRLGTFEARSSRINEFSPRQENGWGNDLTNFSGEKIKDLRLYALTWKAPEGTTLRTEYAESTDYLREALLKAEHTFDLGQARGIDVYATTGTQQDAGKLFDYGGVKGLYEPEQSHDARFMDLSIKYRTGPYYAGFAYNKVWGDDFDRLFFSQDHGTWDSSAKDFYYFGLKNEEMFKLSAGVNFAPLGLPGLVLDTYYARSTHAAGYDNFSRYDFQTVLQYAFQGALKGLSAVWLHDEFETEGTPDGVSRFVASRGPAGIITHDADRFYFSYTYDF
ncbi:OprD family porin [Pseudomonas sp. REP124]|uniref:OprD family outer membrane porin n=1 Tax=Pseudomonas sp. REP124 TaxID=2875731 RepID=UPI001CCE423D|nr:OprD family outer membrane porin [Pseudomonas sp. REP124]MBZ9780220.1 OprD family porin [Pseudomonas sp. REP124]